MFTFICRLITTLLDLDPVDAPPRFISCTGPPRSSLKPAVLKDVVKAGLDSCVKFLGLNALVRAFLAAQLDSDPIALGPATAEAVMFPLIGAAGAPLKYGAGLTLTPRSLRISK